MKPLHVHVSVTDLGGKAGQAACCAPAASTIGFKQRA